MAKTGSREEKIVPVILCGGTGTRLWPLSRERFPKQFVSMFGGASLFQQTAERLTTPVFDQPLILTSDPFRFIALEQLAEVNIRPRSILIEPVARNTAPAILAAALWLARENPDTIMLVAPADHLIPDEQAFEHVVKKALPSAKEGTIVTFGIKPRHADTGYGYLDIDRATQVADETVYKLNGFVEKPNLTRAERMLKAGHYLWNAGIFMMSAKTVVSAFRTHAPDLLEIVEKAVAGSANDLGFERLNAEAFAQAKDISIDYAIMEKADNLVAALCEFDWNDLGSWDAVLAESRKDDSGNAISDSALAIECKNSLLRAENLHLVGIGLEDMIVVAMGDAVLVVPREKAQSVKHAVETMKARGLSVATEFERDLRPWGWFESLARGDRFQVKRIVVDPGAALSLQSHHHRAEHWVVVEGTAKVTIGDEVRLVTENQSVYVPIGDIHRLENPGHLPVVIIEIQTGTYLGEDDITRYEDRYQRHRESRACSVPGDEVD